LRESSDQSRFLEFDDDVDTLKQRSGRGALIVFGNQTYQTLLHFVSTALMARLLSPDDFGLISMAVPVLMFATLVSNMGLGQAVIQRANLTRAELSNLYWFSLTVFTIAGLVVMAISPLVAAFYGIDEISNVVIVYGFLMILNGIGSTHGMVMLRRLRFGYQGMIAVVAQTIGISTGLVAAWIWHSYWALIVTQVVSNVIGLVLVWTFSGWVPGRYDRSVPIGGLLRYGVNVAIARLMNFFTDNADTVLVGKIWGQTALGFYDRAFRLMLTPTGRTTGAIATPAQAVLSRLVRDPERYRRAFLGLNRMALLLVSPGILWAVLFADHLVPLVLGKGWGPVVPIFQAFGALAVTRTMVVMYNWMLLAEGRAKEFRQWGIFRAVIIISAFLVGLQWGPEGVAAAYAAVVIFVLTPLQMVWTTRRSPVRLSDLVHTIVMFLPAFALAAAALIGLERWAGLGLFWLLGFGLIGAYALVWAVALSFPAGRKAVRQGIGVLRAAIERSTPDDNSTFSGVI